MKIHHTLKPIFYSNSKVLILGSIPSVKSREIGFYYAHPSNRFWPTLEYIYNDKIGTTKEDKILFLKKHNIALFDVIKSCDISSSSDNTIRNPEINDLTTILTNSKIKAIFTTGKKAYQLYQKYCYPKTRIETIYLPSTSGANCRITNKEIILAYSKIKEYTDEKNT